MLQQVRGKHPGKRLFIVKGSAYSGSQAVFLDEREAYPLLRAMGIAPSDVPLIHQVVARNKPERERADVDLADPNW